MNLKAGLLITFVGLPIITLGILLIELLPAITQAENQLSELLAFLVSIFAWLPFTLPVIISYSRARKKYKVYAKIADSKSNKMTPVLRVVFIALACFCSITFIGLSGELISRPTNPGFRIVYDPTEQGIQIGDDMVVGRGVRFEQSNETIWDDVLLLILFAGLSVLFWWLLYRINKNKEEYGNDAVYRNEHRWIRVE